MRTIGRQEPHRAFMIARTERPRQQIDGPMIVEIVDLEPASRPTPISSRAYRRTRASGPDASASGARRNRNAIAA